MSVSGFSNWVFKLPESHVFKFPSSDFPIPAYPYSDYADCEIFHKIYEYTLKSEFPVTVAIVYFISVHLINKYIARKQIANAKAKGIKFDQNDPKFLKKLPAMPAYIATLPIFKLFVILHNVFLCVYSAWTFIGIISTINLTSSNYKVMYEKFISTTNEVIQDPIKSKSLFWNSICDLQNGISNPQFPKNLAFYGYLFYLSKFYEILDTIIILLKGRPSMLLQSYHHAGAMLSMWAGVRFSSPPIWIFVCFNSFIHSIMYFYYTLSTLHIKVPSIFKQSLTTLQITQFIIGGSLAVVHLFIHYFDYNSKDLIPCIRDGNQFFALGVNVFYLLPLTFLFVAFWIESYARRLVSKPKKA